MAFLWDVGGSPTASSSPPDLDRWPDALPHEDEPLWVVIDATSPPARVRIAHNAEPFLGPHVESASEDNCVLEDGFLFGDPPPNCLIRARSDGRYEAPLLARSDPDLAFVAVEAVWLHPPDPTESNPVLRVDSLWWAFAVSHA